jgi:hypothetical protein
MSQFTASTFEQAFARYFEPIARDHDWPVIRCSDSLYEILSPQFVMEVSYHQGAHSRSINVVLRPASHVGDQSPIGIWAIAGYNGNPFQYIPWENTAEGFLEEARHMAHLAQEYCLPYLLGQKADADKVREYWRQESEKEMSKIKDYKFPSFVQKRWHLPPSPDDGSKDKK